MATSITALQKEPVLEPWRKIEIRRRKASGYETDWLDVSKYVTQWPVISFETDIIDPWKYRIGSADMRFRNDEGQFSSEGQARSVFSSFITRYRTMVKISTGLKDSEGNELPSVGSIFFGIFSDSISDDIEETAVTINSVMTILDEFPASNIAPSVTGANLTSAEILGTIRDYQDGSGNVVLGTFLSSSAWIISTSGDTFNIPTTTSLDGKTAYDLIVELAQAENYTFYIDKSSNLRYTQRTPTSTSQYNFNGAGAKNVNIQSIDNYSEGISKVFTRISCELFTETVVSTQESFTVGDDSSSWKYGQREHAFSNAYINSVTAGSITSELLDYFVTPKKELAITTKYIAPNLDIKNRVTVTHKGQPGGDGSLWNHFLWDHGLWSDEKGGIVIDGVDFHVTGINVDMQNLETGYFLKEV